MNNQSCPVHHLVRIGGLESDGFQTTHETEAMEPTTNIFRIDETHRRATERQNIVVRVTASCVGTTVVDYQSTTLELDEHLLPPGLIVRYFSPASWRLLFVMKGVGTRVDEDL